MQRTLKRAVKVAGIGLHLGKKAHLVLHPAPVNTGVVFHGVGDRARAVAALHSNVVKESVGFCTRLKDPTTGYAVATVEHVLAAISASGVSNVFVEVSGPEVPILDGSSAPFVDAIARAGVDDQDAAQSVLTIRRPVQVVHADKAAYLLPRPSKELVVSVEVDFAHKGLPRQWMDLPLSAFHSVAAARTFTFEDEITHLQSMGLAKGGSLENAVVFGKSRKCAPLNPDGLRFDDEWVRHKALDAFGDLALAGMPIHGHYVGIRPGHALTHQVLDALFADPSNYMIE
ncbi:Aste57867_21510 [Aphanomyces stellatus]|uniref:UDP-3-O-acyl-N-acetylglucosamine deacetylase n=1 Tax=Aphanomyces stellatus TaxID=120398 RepID=A0A485LHN9_9STRA|nr:hypothetical protein As57867_021441 [Aphanomyces stellatus]VFT98180.1 Aste57867_21510 [Aphanomyces stellatus]